MRIGVAGLGLIGGSLALALRERHEVRGFDVARDVREAAARAGIPGVEHVEALIPADAVIVATPMSAVLPTLAALAPTADGAVLIDVASVRAPVDAFAREDASGARIVGLHPMAGSTDAGFAAARADLFRDRLFLVVPTASSDSQAMAVAGILARDAGGDATVVSADVHDRALAYLSGLPLAAAAATAMVATAQPLEFAGPGLRDTTRLALTPEELALDLLLSNAMTVAQATKTLADQLEWLSNVIVDRDRAQLRDFLRAARGARVEMDRDQRRDRSIS